MTGLPIVAFHNIARAPDGARFRSMYVAPDIFERQMWWLHRLGFRGVSVDQGLGLLASNSVRRHVALTFDDGYLNNLTCAAPILRRFGFGATCYVVTRRIGRDNDWDAASDGIREPLMSGANLSDWLACDLELGSHAASHARLDRVSAEAAMQELIESRDAIQSLTGRPTHHFCYPYGCFTHLTVAMVRRAGYRSAVTTLRGIARPDDDAFVLPRVPVGSPGGVVRFLLKATTPYGDLRRARRPSLAGSPRVAGSLVDDQRS